MLALVGSNGSFAQGREQLEALAGLNITTKAVERQAEAIGGDIAAGEHAEKQRALQLELPTVTGPEIPVLYIEMDGTGVPMVTAETEGRVGKIAGERARTREAKLGCVFTQTRVDEKGRPVRDEASTTYTGAIETAEEFGVLPTGLGDYLFALESRDRFFGSLAGVRFGEALVIDQPLKLKNLGELAPLL